MKRSMLNGNVIELADICLFNFSARADKCTRGLVRVSTFEFFLIVRGIRIGVERIVMF